MTPTCPRCRWPTPVLALCDTCRAEDEAKLRGVVRGPLLDTATPREVRQMGSRQAEMAGWVVAGGGR